MYHSFGTHHSAAKNTEKESFLKTEVKLMSSMLGYEEIELDNDDITFSILNGEKLAGVKKITQKSSGDDAKCTTVNATASDKNVKHLVNELKTFQVTSSKVFVSRFSSGLDRFDLFRMSKTMIC